MEAYTKTPNWLLEAMPQMSGSALKIAMFVSRKTHGWHKDADIISLSQFIGGTGLSRPTVISAIAELEGLGMLKKRAVGQCFSYQLTEPTSKETLPVDAQTSKNSLLVNEPSSKNSLPVDAQTSKNSLPTKERSKETIIKESNQNHLLTFFSELTKLRPRGNAKTRAEKWEMPAADLLEYCRGDIDAAKRRITAAVATLADGGYTISSFASIMTAAINAEPPPVAPKPHNDDRPILNESMILEGAF